MDGKDLYFRPDQNAKYIHVWNIKTAKGKAGITYLIQVVFIHAIAGCDSISRLYGIGKAAPLSKIQCSEKFNRISEVFMKYNAKENITDAGETALVLLYNGNSGDDLDALRYKWFQEK